MKKIFIILYFTMCFAIGFSQTALQTFVSSDNLSSAGIGLLIRDIESGIDILEYNSKTNYNPASLTKLLTTATALETLTDTFKFTTNVKSDGFISTDSVLNGNIYIIGGGDPSLESTYMSPNNFYTNASNAIKKLGIKHIKGKVIGDASLFLEIGSPFQWLVDDVGSYYSPSPSALSAHDTTISLTFQSDLSSVDRKSVV